MWKEAFVPGDIYIMYGGGGPKESIQGLGCSPARSLGRHPSHGYYICSPLCIIYTESQRKTEGCSTLRIAAIPESNKPNERCRHHRGESVWLYSSLAGLTSQSSHQEHSVTIVVVAAHQSRRKGPHSSPPDPSRGLQ
mmetsp:Transcript_18509/g.25585  ORF Transcript_18509/g.25585 Transcript_18509/m.25585 type:complete len:137 (-) Transcript_18509:546-956(-)